jgi:hypothetical protein
LFLWLIGVSILLYASFSQWAGGISWGPRFLVPVLPYLSLLAVIGYFHAQIFSSGIQKALFIILLVCSFLVTAQGLVFRPLDYYMNLSLSASDIFNGAYNFKLAAYPLISAWRDPITLDSFDSFWISKVAIGQLDWIILPMLILLCLVTMIILLIRSLRIPEGTISSSG